MTRTVGKIIHDGEALVIFDDGVAPLYADLVTEVAEKDGIVRLSFAAITQDGDGIPQANVMLRLRLPKDAALSLGKSLQALDK
ncbi:hypothetical protein [Sinorhizobium fredii]|uniref:hypothetical protein n=1 Tax=Rhizobium fredii TaxID=380 RepID=UPI0035142286